MDCAAAFVVAGSNEDGKHGVRVICIVSVVSDAVKVTAHEVEAGSVAFSGKLRGFCGGWY